MGVLSKHKEKQEPAALWNVQVTSFVWSVQGMEQHFKRTISK